MDVGRLLDVVAQRLQARVGRGLVELLALGVGGLRDLVELLVALRLDLRRRLLVGLVGRHALGLELLRDLRLLGIGLLVGLLLVGLLGRVELVEVGLVGLGGLLREVDADQQRAVGADAEALGHEVVGLARVGVVGSAPLSCWPRVRSSTGRASSARITTAPTRQGHGRAATARAQRAQPCGWWSSACVVERQGERVDRVADDREQRRQQRDRRAHRDRDDERGRCSRAW